YLCSGSSASCPTSCSTDASCVAGDFCSGGVCTGKLANGSSFGGPNECQSGFCADGSCGNKACTGSCDVCAQVLGAVANGTCTNVTGVGSPSCAPYLCSGMSPSCAGSCANDAGCAAGNYCSGSQCVPKAGLGSACTVAGQCQSGFCVDGV